MRLWRARVRRRLWRALGTVRARLKWLALGVLLVIGVIPLALAAKKYWSRWELDSAQKIAVKVIAGFIPPCEAPDVQLRCDEEIRTLPKGSYSLSATPVLHHGVDVVALYADRSRIVLEVTPSLFRRSRAQVLHVAHAPPVLQPTCPNPASLEGEWKESPYPEGTRYQLRLKEGPGAVDQQRMIIEALASKYQLARVRPVTSDLIVATGWSASITPEMLAALRCDERILEVENMEMINVD